MDYPAVDVVIATRGDRNQLLQEAVDSVWAQDYPGLVDVTVVYDCENLPSELVTFPDVAGRVGHHVHNEHNHGLAQARNVGASRGSAPLLAFLDDDDLWRPPKLSNQVRLMQTSPGTPLVGTGITIEDHAGVTVDRPAPHTVIRHSDLIRSRVATLHPSGFLMERDSFTCIGGVDEELPGAYAEDYDLLLRLSSRADLAMVEEPLTIVRWTGGSYFFSRWQTISAALRYLLAKHPGFGRDRRGRARIYGQIAFAEAAMRHRKDATRALMRTITSNPLEPRAVLAALVLGGVSPDRIQGALHRRGRGL